MTSRETAIRRLRLEAARKLRKVTNLEDMIRDFEQMATVLDREIAREETDTRIRDINHFAYSTLAMAAAQRRSNLMRSVADLKSALHAAIFERDGAIEQLSRLEVGGDSAEQQQRLRTAVIHVEGTSSQRPQ